MTQQFNPADLRREAQKAQDSLQPLLAAKFYTRLFEQEATFEVAQRLADCYFESLQTDPENIEKVVEWSMKSLELNEKQWESYLLLGQLQQGQEAVDLYKRGLSYLEPLLNDHVSNNNSGGASTMLFRCLVCIDGNLHDGFMR
jgi:hypothetical protein